MKQIMPRSWQDMKRLVLTMAFIVSAFFLVMGANGASAQSSDPEQSGSVGLSGTISAPPPSTGASITFPVNGQNIDTVPIVVTGLCPAGLLVKIFKNNVFAGSVQCENGSFSLQTDLFVGTNELIARVYDDLNQPGPDSNMVSVTYASDAIGTPVRVSLTSNYAKRGAFPGDTLNWPVLLSGGTGPYAFSVDWGDSKEPDLFTISFPGEVDLKHVYDKPGIFNVIVKVVDSNGVAAFLQLVGVGNGPLSQENQDGKNDEAALTSSPEVVVWWPATLIVPFTVSTFWLGKRYMLKVIRTRLERGEHPFANF